MTVSALDRKIAWFVASIITIILCIVALVSFVNAPARTISYGDSVANVCFEPYPDFTAGKTRYASGADPKKCRLYLERVSTDEARAKGLSGRKELSINYGMLFEFDAAGTHCMWMKSMNIPIDMIWVNEEKRIVKIEANVSPSTYPASFCNTDSSAQYVIETNAKVAESLGLKVGQQVTF